MRNFMQGLYVVLLSLLFFVIMTIVIELMKGTN